MADEEVIEQEAETAEAEQRQSEADVAAEAAEKKGGKKAAKKANGAAEEAVSAEAAGDEESAAQADWREQIKDEKAKKLAGKYESLDALAQGVSKLQSQLSDRIKLPGKDATDEDTAKFRKAMGIPEKADDYKIELPEGMEIGEDEQAVIDALKPIAHEENLPSSAFSRFVARFKEFEQQVMNEYQANLEKAREDAIAELKKEMGKDYEPNLNIATRAMKQLGGDELAEFMDKMELKDGGLIGDHPQMVRLFAKLGRQLSEDGTIAPVDADTAKNLNSEIQRLTSEAMAAQRGGDTAKADKLFKERDQIAQRLYGEEPIVGGGGRAT